MGQSRTKLNKTWRQSRGFHQFRGELPGYRLNAPRLYNESLKTVPSGFLSPTHSHIWTCRCVYAQIQFQQKNVGLSKNPSVMTNHARFSFLEVFLQLIKKTSDIFHFNTLLYALIFTTCAEQIFDSFCDVISQYYFTVTFNHDNQKALELRTEDVKDCDEWVAAITQARYVSHMTSHLHTAIQTRNSEEDGCVKNICLWCNTSQFNQSMKDKYNSSPTVPVPKCLKK